MRLWTLFVCTGVALAVGVASATAAGGGNSANAKLCQKNGWQTLARSTGQPFANEQDCVSYGAKGGTYGTPLPDLRLVVSSDCSVPFPDIDECRRFDVEIVGPVTVTGQLVLQAQLTAAPPTLPARGAFAGNPPCVLFATVLPSPTASASATCQLTGAGAGVIPNVVVGVGADQIPSGVTVTVTAQVDPNNVIAEWDETNNTYTETFTAPAPG